MSDLFEFFQSGFYEKFWKHDFSEKDSKETAENIINLLNLKSGHILDWCGGWGRISIWLAKAGFKITLLDFIYS